MAYIVTVVAADQLNAAHIATVTGVLETHGLTLSGAPAWLAPHKAADLPVTQRPDAEQVRALRALLAADRIDVFVSPLEHRRKKLLIADMDSTIVTAETLDELAAHAGLQDKIAEITARAMRGELDFRAAVAARVGMLKGLPETALAETLAHIEITSGAQILVRTMAQHGAPCVLVSGGFTCFTGPIAAQVGFAHHHGNELIVQDGCLAGTVGEPLLDQDAKRRFLDDYAARCGLTLAETAAVGDGANDLPMLRAAGLGVGYYPKPLLQDALDNCIFHTDLTSLLYAQGYRADEFAAAE